MQQFPISHTIIVPVTESIHTNLDCHCRSLPSPSATQNFLDGPAVRISQVCRVERLVDSLVPHLWIAAYSVWFYLQYIPDPQQLKRKRVIPHTAIQNSDQMVAVLQEYFLLKMQSLFEMLGSFSRGTAAETENSMETSSSLLAENSSYERLRNTMLDHQEGSQVWRSEMSLVCGQELSSRC